MLAKNYIEIDGKRLETQWHGPSPGETLTLVFLHEGLGCVAMWRDFPARLAEATGCGALVFSRLGYGRSDACSLPRPISFMHEEGLNVMPAFLEAAGIEACILIGHSDGGSISIIYAGGTPALPLKGLITEAAHVFCEDLSVKSIRDARDQYLNGNLREKLAKYHGDNVDCAFWGWNGAWLDPDFMQWNLEEFLLGIKVPMLAIQGEQDQYGTPAQLEAIARQAGGQTKAIMLPDCAHAPHKDQTEATFQAMKAFILKIKS